jgi:hypothetical protein
MNTHDTFSIKGVLATGTVAPDFTLHVTPDQTLSLSEARQACHPRFLSRRLEPGVRGPDDAL